MTNQAVERAVDKFRRRFLRQWTLKKRARSSRPFPDSLAGSRVPYRSSIRACIQSKTSCSTQKAFAYEGAFSAKRDSLIRLGKSPCFSSLLRWLSLYGTNSNSCFFDNSFIDISRLGEVSIPRGLRNPREPNGNKLTLQCDVLLKDSARHSERDVLRGIS